MKILGVDPGSRLLGYGIIEKVGNRMQAVDHGTINLFHKEYKNIPVDETTPSRLREIYEGLSDVIKKYRPEIMAVEKVFFAKNAVSALKLGQARGVVLVTGALHDLEIFEYSVTEVKSAITGHGRAEKEQVAKMLQLMLGAQRFATVDASDALALAVAHGLANRSTKTPLPKTGRSKKGSSLKALAQSLKSAK
ncbi:MAG: crossover junction endodeoxyribonuclease RuvC [Bdellovibrionales bacterium]|nr:crossover junction endodeoxyribonuclease RuvC [Bdellovibrionales bacterium]